MKNKATLPSTARIGYGQGCLKPRGADIWDKFPRNLAVKIDSKASRAGSVQGKGGASLLSWGIYARCSACSSLEQHGLGCTRTRGGRVASRACQKGSPFPNLEHKYFWKTI